MQKRIYRAVALTVLAAVALLTVINAVISYGTYKSQAEVELRNIARLVLSREASPEGIEDMLSEISYSDIRVTVISADGSVLYDNAEDAETMENHRDRPEIASAFSTGYGEAERFSDTIGAKTYYYAVEKDGDVYRFSRRLESTVAIMWEIVPMLIVTAGIVVIISLIFSIKLSESVMRPVNELVGGLDLIGGVRQEPKTEYAELVPVEAALKKLSSRVEKYITRLKEEKETITLITENMAEGMILLDAGRDILSVNRSAIGMLNPHFVPNEGQNILELTRNPDFTALLDRADEAGNVYGRLSLDERFYEVFVSNTEPDMKKGTVVIILDVTERAESERMRREFSANVSHELKTPLTTIKGFAEMISTGALTSPEDIRRYTGRIYTESERLLLLINDIIRLSEIEEHEKNGAEVIDLSGEALSAAEAVRFAAEKKNISIETEAESVLISGNRAYIGELFTNLIDNAVKYNNDGGRVKVSVKREGGCAVITVEDNGIGIPPEHHDKVFQRFYRADKSRSKQTGGTGLGLSIVKHVTEYHGGRLSLESCPGRGTKITVSIPVA